MAAAFWVFPGRQLAIVNIVNPEGASLARTCRPCSCAILGGRANPASNGSQPPRAHLQNAAMDMKVTSISDSFVDSREFARMTRAIEFIEREFERQPRLAEIARHVGLSEFHFNRLFRRWTGLTPKQYLAEITSRAASTALRDEPSVLDAAHSVGLSGGGRLHDLTVTLEAMTPGEIRGAGRGCGDSAWRGHYAVRHGIPGRDAARTVPPRIRRARRRARRTRRSCASNSSQAHISYEMTTALQSWWRKIWGNSAGQLPARRVRHQLPGTGVARAARTRTRYDGHIRRAGEASGSREWCARRRKRGGGESDCLGNTVSSRSARGWKTRRLSLGNCPQTDDSSLGRKARRDVIAVASRDEIARTVVIRVHRWIVVAIEVTWCRYNGRRRRTRSPVGLKGAETAVSHGHKRDIPRLT